MLKLWKSLIFAKMVISVNFHGLVRRYEEIFLFKIFVPIYLVILLDCLQRIINIQDINILIGIATSGD